MSEPRIGTGETRIGECRLCGAAVEQQEHVGMYGSGPAWSTQPHTAPCGLPCFGGGTRGKDGLAAYKAGKMHGLVGAPPKTYPATDYQEEWTSLGVAERPCPACTGLPPVSTAEARR